MNGDFVGCLWWSQLVEEVEERESKYKFNFFFLGGLRLVWWRFCGLLVVAVVVLAFRGIGRE